VKLTSALSKEIFEMEPRVPPLTIPIELAGELLGCSRPAAYGAAKAGFIPIIPGPGRKKVPVAKLEELVGRRITCDDLDAAHARLAPKRRVFIDYQRRYREARQALTATGPA
jgi:hypothetical protein